MKSINKYRFLLKPAFFIFNVLFAAWLVFKIEKIHPSDFGMKETHHDVQRHIRTDKATIRKLCSDYKAGVLDSTGLEKKIDACFTMGSDTISRDDNSQGP